MVFTELLRDSFQRHAARPAIVHRGQTLTYAALEQRARNAAAWLQNSGVEPGDSVVLSTENKPAFLVAHLGALFAGAISLPLNPRFTREELRFFLADGAASTALVDAGRLDLIEWLRPGRRGLRPVSPAATMLDAPAGNLREPTLGADDPCLLIYSSGTTGWPKGIVHTNANVASALLALQKC